MFVLALLPRWVEARSIRQHRGPGWRPTVRRSGVWTSEDPLSHKCYIGHEDRGMTHYSFTDGSVEVVDRFPSVRADAVS